MKKIKSVLFLIFTQVLLPSLVCQNKSLKTHYQASHCSKKQAKCLPELPRNPVGKAYVGYRYPTYYQGYPYYGVYNYGSFRGYSYSI